MASVVAVATVECHQRRRLESDTRGARAEEHRSCRHVGIESMDPRARAQRVRRVVRPPRLSGANLPAEPAEQGLPHDHHGRRNRWPHPAPSRGRTHKAGMGFTTLLGFRQEDGSFEIRPFELATHPQLVTDSFRFFVHGFDVSDAALRRFTASHGPGRGRHG